MHKGTDQMHNVFGADANGNDSQDHLISLTSNANNNDNNNDRNWNQNNNDLTPSQTSEEQSNLIQAQNKNGVAWTMH